MTGQIINPAGIAAPVGAYSHGIVCPAEGRWLHVSGQVGVLPDGRLADGFAAQVHAAWSNLVAVLQAAGMDVSNLVKVTTFLTRAADLPALNPVRSSFLGETRPASTLLVVQALARPEWLIEVEAVAWRP